MKKIYAIIALALMTTALAACTNEPASEALSYADYPQLENWQDLEDIDEAGIWLTFYYSDSCDLCLSIREDVVAFIDQHGDDFPTYFLEHGHVGTPPNSGIVFTPTVVVMHDGGYVEHHGGVPAVLSLLSNLADGTYTLPEGND